MKQIEMWKWFKLPVDCELIPTDCTGDSDSVSFSGAKVLTDHHVEKVEIAINSYDANQELIAKQAEQIKMLRKAFEEIGGYEKIDVSNRVFDIAENALEATKDSV